MKFNVPQNNLNSLILDNMFLSKGGDITQVTNELCQSCKTPNLTSA